MTPIGHDIIDGHVYTGLPHGYDPDGYIRDHGADALREIIRGTLTYEARDWKPEGRPFKARRARIQRRPPAVPMTPAEVDAAMAAFDDHYDALVLRRLAQRWPVGGGGDGPIDAAALAEVGARALAERVVRQLATMDAERAARPRIEGASVEARATAYLRSANGGVRGQGRSKAFADICIKMVCGWDLAEHVAAAMLMDDYAARCDPRWSRREVEAKVRWAGRATRCGRGWLRDRERR